MRWTLSHRADPNARELADRHYNRQKVGSPQFVPPGRCLVLYARTGSGEAFWITSWPFAEYVKHEWAGAWVCSAFRNEAAALSSELITEALAASKAYFGAPPPLGMITFVDGDKVRRKRDLGRCLPQGRVQARRLHQRWSACTANSSRGHAGGARRASDASWPAFLGGDVMTPEQVSSEPVQPRRDLEAAALEAAKTCPHCGRDFPKPHRTSSAQWAKREFCSRQCAEGARARTKPWAMNACRAPELDRARRQLRTAISKGEVIRRNRCDGCGMVPPPMKDGRSSVQAHHHDYDKPLDVRWLCVKCHRDVTPITPHRKGSLPGSRNPQSKLNEGAVAKIRRLHATGAHTSKELSTLFGVSLTVIRDVVARRAWTHVR